jgi:hypothetical protein
MKRVSIYKQRWKTGKSYDNDNWLSIYTVNDQFLTGAMARLARHIVALHNASLKGEGK